MLIRHLTSCLWLVCFSSGCLHNVRVDVESTQELSSEGLKYVVVETHNGRARIVCRAGPGPVRLRTIRFAHASTEEAAREGAAAIRIVTERVTPDTGTLNLRALPPASGEWPRSGGAHFELELPQGVDIHARSSNGRLEIHGARGNLDLKTSNGAVAILDAQGDVEAHTSNGQIHLTNIEGGRINASTSNGPIEAQRISGEPTLQTTNGRIRLLLDRTSTTPWISAVTSNGSIELEVPESVAAELSLQTSSASIQHDLGNFDSVSGLESSRCRIRATLNGGGGAIKAKTSNGEIRFRSVR